MDLASGEKTEASADWPRKALVWAFLAGLAIRLIASYAFVVMYAPIWAQDREDHWTYSYESGRVARSLATGHGFSDPLRVPSGPTAWLPPVYPLIFAGIFKIFGIYSMASLFAMRVFNSIASALTCLPVFYIARSLSKRTGIWAAWAWALFPHGIWAAVITWDFSLSALLIACLVALTLYLRKDPPLSAWIGYGVLWGIAVLTNATLLAALPFLLSWLWFQQPLLRRAWILQPAVTILAFLAVLSPWVVRNYLVFHQPFLIKSVFWLAFNVGNSTHQTTFFNGYAHPDDSASELNDYVQRGEMAYMAEQKLRALDFLRGHAALYIWLCLRRFVYIWTGFWSLSPAFLASNADGGYRHIALISACSIPFVLGLLRGLRRKRGISLLLFAVPFSVPFANYLTHPGPYRYVVDPEVVILAVYGVVPFLLWAKRQFSGQDAKLPSAAVS